MDAQEFDVLFDYDRVRRALHLFSAVKKPNMMAGDFLARVKGPYDSRGRRLREMGRYQPSPRKIVDYLECHADYGHIVAANREEMLYAAEYYMVWESLPHATRKAIQEERRLVFVEGGRHDG